MRFTYVQPWTSFDLLTYHNDHEQVLQYIVGQYVECLSIILAFS